MEKQPWHFTQAYNVEKPENDLDFFDTNLKYDSPLFIDPMLLKKSTVKEEVQLYGRFTEYFDLAMKRALSVGSNTLLLKSLKSFLSFPEPTIIGLGYTENSTDGSGLKGEFASALSNFFMGELAKKIIANKDIYPDKEINPEIFALFADKVDVDGISDLSADLLMDYLIKYTQEQCNALGIALKKLPIKEYFDFENEQWSGGGYFMLPENPLRQGKPVVLIPKRLLRQKSNSDENIKSKTIAILEEDPNLKEKFGSVLSKPVKEITVDEIKNILLANEDAMVNLIKAIEKETKHPYDFIEDPLQLLAYKKYKNYFDGVTLPKAPEDGESLTSHTKNLISLFKQEQEIKGGWKDAWHKDKNGREIEIDELTWGRRFRAMGYIYFSFYPEITFDNEVESGNGPVDFRVVFKENCNVIEFKKLSNSALKGEKGNQLPSYIHGIQRQLPEYAINLKAMHAFYVTGQHQKRTHYSKTDHTYRVKEIQDLIPTAEASIKVKNDRFGGITYVNIDLSKKRTASNL